MFDFGYDLPIPSIKMTDVARENRLRALAIMKMRERNEFYRAPRKKEAGVVFRSSRAQKN